MKKVMKTVLIILMIAIGIAAVVILILNLVAKGHAPIVSFRSSYGGDMTGGNNLVSIEALDSKALITTEKREWYGQDPAVGEYYVPLSVLDDIEQVFDKYKIYKFDKLPESPVHVLDAGSTSYRIGYENGDALYFTDNKIISQKGWEGLRKIDDILDSATAQGEKLPGLVIGDEYDEWNNWQPPEGGIGLHVFEYIGGKLCYKFGSDCETDVEFEAKAVLYRLDGDERTEVWSEDGPWLHTVYSVYYNDEETISTGRLEPGKYALTVGEYEEEFDIR